MNKFLYSSIKYIIIQLNNHYKVTIYVLIYYICTYKNEVMDTKLTLKLNKDVIGRAKEYASTHKQSLSRIIESYLQSLVSKEEHDTDKDTIEISAFVKSMSTGVHLPVDLDAKKEYSDYLSEKYK